MSQHITKQPNGKYAIFSTVVDSFVAYDATREDVFAHFRSLAIESSDRATERGLLRADSPHSIQGFNDDIDTMRIVHGDAEADKYRTLLSEGAPDAPECKCGVTNSEQGV